jgi:hypothetical protein
LATSAIRSSRVIDSRMSIAVAAELMVRSS